MDIQELNTFVTIAQCGSFSKAADYLGYSQSAMTVRIKNLEEELGVRLFDRIGKKVSLTHQGNTLYGQAIKILNDVQAAKESVHEEHAPVGMIKIGTIDSLCSSVFPEIMKQYHDRFPEVQISVVTDTPPALLEKLRDNEIDVAYLVDERNTDPLLMKEMEIEEQAVFAAAIDYPIPDDVTTVTQLQNYPLILTESDASYRRVLDSTLSFRKLRLIPFFECDNTDLIIQMMLAEKGVAFLPDYTIAKYCTKKKVKRILLEDVDVKVYRQVLHHKDKWVTREMKELFNLIEELEKKQTVVSR